MKTALIVDDAAFIRLSLKTTLEKNGYKVIGEASDGDIAVTKYRELKPDFVTMDITMPRVDGIVALKQILKMDSKAIVIMVSALGQERYIKESVKAGAKYFFVKPFKDADVLEVVRKIVGN